MSLSRRPGTPRAPADAEACDDAAPGDLIDHGEVLSEAIGSLERRQHHTGTELDPFGGRCERRKQGKKQRKVSIGGEVVSGAPRRRRDLRLLRA